MKEKILFFIFDLGHGGAEKVLVQLVNALPKDKYDITVQTLFDVGINKDSFESHINRKRVFKKLFHGMKYLIRLFPPRLLHKLLIKEHYDYEIAYLEGAPTRIVSGCRDKDTKLFAWVHIEMIDKHKFFSTYWSLNDAKHCYQRFDKIAFVSDIAQTTFLEKTGWTFIESEVVHNTLDVQQILSLSKEPISFDLSDKAINFCSVGRLVNQKGYVRLMKILTNILMQGITNWHLYLLGEGDLRNEIENEIKVGGLDNYVTLLGYDSNPYKYVSKMDYFVCSSYKEGYSTAVTESVIVGTPVITTDCAGMHEILGEDAGLIVENADIALQEALIYILSDQSLKIKYKDKCIQRSTKFSKESTIKEFEDFIHD
ncbi:MAG: glycosyltransferase [Muribaculaceae bacterium]|nr:glycosyltransferase [Muribaculaceae bacterium]